MSTLMTWLKESGKLRLGRRTPETVYASFDDNLDDRSTNFPVSLFQDVDLGQFVVEAVNEKLERGRCENIDPEAWLADQLAQCIVPSQARFAAVERIAQEYGEMCATRAREAVTKHELPVELWWSPTGSQVLFRSGTKYFRVGDGGHGGYPKLPAGSVRLLPTQVVQ